MDRCSSGESGTQTKHPQKQLEEGEEGDSDGAGGVHVCNLKAARWWMKADDRFTDVINQFHPQIRAV